MDLSNFERLLETGKKIHLEGEKLQQFIQQAMEREERTREREEARRRTELEETRRREEMEWEREREEREREERERMRVHEVEIKHIELQAAQLVESQRRGRGTTDTASSPKLPPFVDDKDDIDCYLQRFERFARSLTWPTESWATRLSALLTGKALDVYSRVSNEDAEDYNVLKQTLLTRYDMTENGFRGKFRQSKPETGECPKQYMSRLAGYLTRWIDMSKTLRTFEGIRDLMAKEQYMNSCPRDLAVHLRERAPADLAEVVKISGKYLAAHDRSLASLQPPGDDPPMQMGRMGRNSRPYGAELHPRDPSRMRCYNCNRFGHRAVDCRQRDPQAGWRYTSDAGPRGTTGPTTADSIPDEFDDEGKQVVVGICAMDKKSGSRPMKEILTRLEEFEYIKCLIFPEHVILKEPVENWPLCDCLISFHSKGFPLEKAIQYSQLRKPFIINNLQMQYALQDRRKVYRLLEREGIDLPRFAILDRDAPDFVEERDFMESDDVVEVGGVTFNKPFVEKPVSAEDHNIYIYYPSSAGGGSQRLFRKIGSRSSVYSPESRLRRTGSYIYENFMPTDGTDVKVYTVGPEYAHAEARKSPALDGKVERDQDGKEVRYPVILTNNEKLIARKVCQTFKQTVCGFDLLRANGRSYVCDVNGFSFVKNSNKYYDDSAKILGNMVLRELAPTLHIPWSVPFQLDDPPIVPTTFGKMMELRCAIAVIRHGDRTPKQKMKMEIRHQKFFAIFHKYDGAHQGHIKLKKPKQLQEILDVARELLEGFPGHPEVVKKRAKLEQLRNVLEMYGHFSGINRKIQMKYQPKGWKRSSEDESSDDPSLVLVLKWGGELTPAGRVQAEELGKIFRCMYPGGQGIMQPWGSGMSEGFPAYHWEYAGTQGLGLLRLHSTYRHDLKIYASDEGRVQMTAAAFAKGLLALEGELTPILVQMVKSADTNGLLDNDSDSRNLLNMVKSRIHDLFQQDRDFTAEDIHQLNPTGSISVAKALSRLNNPVETCQLVYNHLQKLLAIITPKMEESKELILYHGETWELMMRRWVKLEKDFKTSNGKFDISKIPDIYDNIKYDLQHNQKVLQFDDAEEMYRVAKTVADVIVPQEYGLTRQEKLSIGHGICTPLLKKIQADLRRNVDEGAEENVNRLNPMYSRGVSSPQRHVRTRLYFTSESHLHSLLTMLRYGGLADEARDEQWRRAMDYCSAVSELNYMSQVVIMLYEDPTKDLLSENRFHVELHFSPGVNCCVQKNPPQGPGFRPQSRGDMNKLTNTPGRRPPSMIEEEDGETPESGSEPDRDAQYQSGACGSQRLPSSQPINISRCATSPSHLSPPHQDLLRSCSHPGSPDRRSGGEERPRSLEGMVERGMTEPPPASRPDGINSSEQDTEDEELRRQRHSVPSQYAQKLSILNQQLQLGAPGGSGSSLFSTAVISGSSSAPELKSLFTPVTAIGIEGCGGVPSIRPLETLHNAMSLRQVNAFIDRVTSMEFRAPPPAQQQADRPPPLALHSPTQSLSISGPSSFVSSPGSTTPLDGARTADGW